MRELSYLVLVVALLMGAVWAGVREGKVLEWKDMEVWLKTDVLPMISKHSLRNYTLETTKEGRYVQGRAKNEETFTITVEPPDPGVKHTIPVLIDWDSGCTDSIKAAF